ncbi:Zinc/iron permease [Viridothelium virens]|uniref:Zinc/iron permease n=1 Tax=Viridothelium virens TaxID=1048519 RepID=A0A6A6HEE8_VIRVR|nr:Zinc/iron permease [Viridothelium virens]
MWDGLLVLLTLSTIMAVASFLAGALPLSFALSQKSLRTISAIGTGVLVGTALIVIIPEGVETLYSSQMPASSRSTSRNNLQVRNIEAVTFPLVGRGYDQDYKDLQNKEKLPGWGIEREGETLDGDPAEEEEYESGRGSGWLNLGGSSKDSSKDKTGSSGSTKSSKSKNQDKAASLTGSNVPEKFHASTTRGNDHELHVWIGISLILGFILMYLIDRLPQHAHERAHAKQKPMHISLSNLSQGLHRASSPSPSHVDDEEDIVDVPHGPVQKGSSTTIGLVIHAAADGIALGAGSSMSSSNLGFIVFVAIMIHKAPAAFGLTSVLLKQGLTRRTARTHLVIFSLAAPFGAISTFIAVHLFGSGILGGENGTKFVTGVLLLFSGGTFLYVAMHTMQENAGHEHAMATTNGHADQAVYEPFGRNGHKKAGPSLGDTCWGIFGMLLPLLTQFGHSH